MVTIEITTLAARQFRKVLPIQDRLAIDQAIQGLQSWPDCPLVKKLSERNDYRLRVKNWRVIFTVQGGTPVVVRIEAIRRRNERTYQ